jgi:hypothetical protein
MVPKQATTPTPIDATINNIPNTGNILFFLSTKKPSLFLVICLRDDTIKYVVLIDKIAKIIIAFVKYIIYQTPLFIKFILLIVYSTFS